LKRSFAEDDAAVAEEQAHLAKVKAAEEGDELYPGLGEEKEERHLLEMDAKEWKVRYVV
jgi:DnaJ family protein C protein 2